MTDLIQKLKTPEECAIFEKNALERGRPDLALAARKKGVELRAISYGAESAVERECLEAIYAYEQILSTKNGKKTRASRTWQLIAKHGIINAVERAVVRKDDAFGYVALKEMGLEEYAFESVVLRNQDAFSHEAVEYSTKRVTS